MWGGIANELKYDNGVNIELQQFIENVFVQTSNQATPHLWKSMNEPDVHCAQLEMYLLPAAQDQSKSFPLLLQLGESSETHEALLSAGELRKRSTLFLPCHVFFLK